MDMSVPIKAEVGLNKSPYLFLYASSRGTLATGPSFIAAVTLTMALFGCSSNCLPEPNADDTPPEVRIIAEYTSRPEGVVERVEIGSADSSVTLSADSDSPVHIIYVAADTSGVRRLIPGMTIQQTVGIGVERQHVSLGREDASCPRPTLEREHEVHGTGQKRALIITLGAENWVGLRSSIEPVTIRLD